jgi:GNAT superfamily N-acetyltransferase
MDVTLRPGRPDDAEECGRICYEAFAAIAVAHGYQPDFPSVEVATRRMAGLLALVATRSVIAESGGRIVGSNFIHARWPVAAIGPITVDPATQGDGFGRRLMEDTIEWARGRRFPSIRLVQAAYHNRSLALYAQLGFDAREPLTAVQGPPLADSVPGRAVRPATRDDMNACNDLCARVHGLSRSFELAATIERGAAKLVVRDGRIVGYSTEIGFSGHAIGETNEDLEALIAAAPGFTGPGFLLPTRNGDVLRWCLDHGLRIVQPMTLMSLGWYQEPRGRFLPSIGY